MNSFEDLEDVMETKLRENLKWSMLFFIFNYITSEISKKEKQSDDKNINKDFFKNWKKHTCENMVKKDLESINSILNSPKNVFYSALQNSGDIIESTELYQEKYNLILKKVEEFYYNNISTKENNND